MTGAAPEPQVPGRVSGRRWRTQEHRIELRGVSYRLRLVSFAAGWLASVDTVEGPTLGCDHSPYLAVSRAVEPLGGSLVEPCRSSPSRQNALPAHAAPTSNRSAAIAAAVLRARACSRVMCTSHSGPTTSGPLNARNDRPAVGRVCHRPVSGRRNAKPGSLVAELAQTDERARRRAGRAVRHGHDRAGSARFAPLPSAGRMRGDWRQADLTANGDVGWQC